MRRPVLSGILLAGALFATPVAAQTAGSPGIDETVAYIRERCHGVVETVPGIGEIRHEWALDQATSTMVSTQNDNVGSAETRIPVRYVTFSTTYDDPSIAVRCPDKYLTTQCPNNTTGRGAMRYVNIFCRERDKAINALNHLQQLMGGPAPASDPFA